MKRTIRILLLAAVAISGASRAEAQTSTGTLDLFLKAPPGDTSLIQSTSVITSPSLGLSRTTTLGEGTGSFEFPGLPIANDYRVHVTSTTRTGQVCSGGNLSPSPILGNTVTILLVTLTCPAQQPTGAPALGPYVPFLAATLAIVGILACGPTTLFQRLRRRQVKR
jgi:hypothetical protein